MDGADIWVKETKHIVQPYRVVKKRGLVAVDALPVSSAVAARARAQKLYETGHYAGVDAFTMTSDSELGEYGAPKFHVRLGQAPDYD